MFTSCPFVDGNGDVPAVNGDDVYDDVDSRRVALLSSADSGSERDEAMLVNFLFCSSQLVGLLLIGVAAWGKGFGLVSSIHIIGGVIAVGVFLLLIAIVGLIGAMNHHQVMLFFVSFLTSCLGRVAARRRWFEVVVLCFCLVSRRFLDGCCSTWSFSSSCSSSNLEFLLPAWQ